MDFKNFMALREEGQSVTSTSASNADEIETFKKEIKNELKKAKTLDKLKEIAEKIKKVLVRDEDKKDFQNGFDKALGKNNDTENVKESLKSFKEWYLLRENDNEEDDNEENDNNSESVSEEEKKRVQDFINKYLENPGAMNLSLKNKGLNAKQEKAILLLILAKYIKDSVEKNKITPNKFGALLKDLGGNFNDNRVLTSEAIKKYQSSNVFIDTIGSMEQLKEYFAILVGFTAVGDDSEFITTTAGGLKNKSWEDLSFGSVTGKELFFDKLEGEEGDINYKPIELFNNLQEFSKEYFNSNNKFKFKFDLEELGDDLTLNNFKKLIESESEEIIKTAKKQFDKPKDPDGKPEESNKDSDKYDENGKTLPNNTFERNAWRANKLTSREESDIDKQIEKDFGADAMSDRRDRSKPTKYGYSVEYPKVFDETSINKFFDDLKAQYDKHIVSICAEYAKRSQLRSEKASRENAKMRVLDDHGLSDIREEIIASAFKRAGYYNNTLTEGTLSNLLKSGKDNIKSLAKAADRRISTSLENKRIRDERKKTEKENKKDYEKSLSKGLIFKKGAEPEYEKAREKALRANKSYWQMFKEKIKDPGFYDKELGEFNDDNTLKKTKGYERASGLVGKYSNEIGGGLIEAAKKLANVHSARALGGRITLQQRLALESKIESLMFNTCRDLWMIEDKLSDELRGARSLINREPEEDANIRRHDRLNRQANAEHDADIIANFLETEDSSSDDLYDMRVIGKMIIASILASQSKFEDGKARDGGVTSEKIRKSFDMKFSEFANSENNGMNLFFGENKTLYFYSLRGVKSREKCADYSKVQIQKMDSVRSFLNNAFENGKDFREVMQALENPECYDIIRQKGILKEWVRKIKKYNLARRRLYGIFDKIDKGATEKMSDVIKGDGIGDNKITAIFESKFSKYGEKIIIEGLLDAAEKIRAKQNDDSRKHYELSKALDQNAKISDSFKAMKGTPKESDRKAALDELTQKLNDTRKKEQERNQMINNAAEATDKMDVSRQHIIKLLDDNCCYIKELNDAFGPGDNFGFNGNGVEDVAMRQNFVGKKLFTFLLNNKMFILNPERNNLIDDIKKNLKEFSKLTTKEAFMTTKEMFKNKFRDERINQPVTQNNQQQQQSATQDNQQQPQATVTTAAADSTYGNGYAKNNPINRMKEIIYKNGKYTVKTRQMI